MILYTQIQNHSGIVQIIAGQYCGIGTLAVLSILGALGTQMIPPEYIGLLGFLPLFLGIRSWITYRNAQKKQTSHASEPTKIHFFSVFLLTMANGSDNIGVYIPVFSGYTPVDFAITLIVFALLIALWCYLGFILANYPYIRKTITRYQHFLVPLVLMALGIAILAENYLL